MKASRARPRNTRERRRESSSSLSNSNAFHTLLDSIHKKLVFSGGSLKEELPEQLLVVEFLPSTATVLEIGANVGRNTLTIASILDDSSRLVTLESDPKAAAQLIRNRNANRFRFHVENSALSAVPLVQNGWQSFPLSSASKGSLEKGWFRVQTFDLDALVAKYKLAFDTLVLDCEGAFFYILRDFPTILDGVCSVFIENDFRAVAHKQFVDERLRERGFAPICSRAGGWGPCANAFYQVWRRERA